MSYTYNYTRDIIDYDVNGITGKCWDIDNRNRVDAEGNQIFLSNEIHSAIPNYHFSVDCNNADACVIFDSELTSDENIVLDNVVITHKNNS